MRLLLAIIGMSVLVACIGGSGGGGTRGTHASARILLKKVNSECKSRTVPPSHVMLKGEEDEIVWQIRVKDGCLDGETHLVIKWVDAMKNPITDPAKVPTKCLEINTKDNGNKSRIHCDLRDDVPEGKYAYQVYLRVGSSDTVIEDPDVEIVMF
jgi:hypothetical protein